MLLALAWLPGLGYLPESLFRHGTGRGATAAARSCRFEEMNF
jgi:hypothetical protein